MSYDHRGPPAILGLFKKDDSSVILDLFITDARDLLERPDHSGMVAR
jgi:hypothetical protein